MPMSAEHTARLQHLRGLAIAGKATQEELREGLAILRQDRVAAQASSTTARTKKAEAAAPVDTSALLSNLKALGQKLSSGPVA